MEYDFLYKGAFVVLYGQENGQTYILVSERGAHFKGKSEGWGTVGGFVDIQNGKREQPKEGACRETREELIQPDKSPVISTITPDRLKYVDDGIDYNAGRPGTHHAGNHWTGYACELTAEEIAALRRHVDLIKNDPAYADAMRAASNQEVEQVVLMTPQELIFNMTSGKIKFAYEHEGKVVLEVARQLQAAPAPKNGPRRGGWGC